MICFVVDVDELYPAEMQRALAGECPACGCYFGSVPGACFREQLRVSPRRALKVLRCAACGYVVAKFWRRFNSGPEAAEIRGSV